MSSIFDSFFATLGIGGASAVIRALVIFIICFIVIKILWRVVSRLLDRSKRIDATLKGFISTVLHIVLWALAGIIVADALGINTASLVAVVSVAGLALSLSVQNIMANVFSGVTLLFTRPFKAGDFVEIAANTGTIRSIGLFYTVIVTLDNRVITVPNGDVTAASIINYSHEPLRRVDMTFSASYDDSTEAVRNAIMDAIRADAKILTDPAPFVAVSKYGDNSVEYVVRLWCDNADYWDVYFGMNERVRESFAANGVSMSYPHLNVHMVQ